MNLKIAVAFIGISTLVAIGIGSPMPERKGEVDIVIESDDGTALDELGDALLPELRKDPQVADAEDGLPQARAFLERRVWLFLTKDELHELRGDIEARWDWEVSHAAGYAIDDGPPPSIDRHGHARKLRDWIERLNPIYYRAPEGNALVIQVITMSREGAVAHVRSVVDRVRKTSHRSDVKVEYAGDIGGDSEHAEDIANRVLRPRAVPKLTALVPPDQADKIPDVLAIAGMIERAHARGIIPERSWRRLEPFVPPNDLAPFTTADLDDVWK